MFKWISNADVLGLVIIIIIFLVVETIWSKKFSFSVLFFSFCLFSVSVFFFYDIICKWISKWERERERESLKFIYNIEFHKTKEIRRLNWFSQYLNRNILRAEWTIRILILRSNLTKPKAQVLVLFYSRLREHKKWVKVKVKANR